ncbi:MAG TPA: hypothetical protein VGU63_05115 [Candidatus Acidoferrales bacterium]|nr:hypothetical protein [Candidatus Acidoferrales bacterium]
MNGAIITVIPMIGAMILVNDLADDLINDPLGAPAGNGGVVKNDGAITCD